MKRWQVMIIAAIVLSGLAVLVGYHLGVRTLEGKIVEALGPGARLKELKVNWFSIELLGLSIDGGKDWPAPRTLLAERVTIVPDLRTLLTDQIRISSIVVQRPYLSLLRTPGKLRIVPSLTEGGKNLTMAASSQSRAYPKSVIITTIELTDATVDLYDATVGRSPLRIRLERIDAAIRDIAVPAFGKTRFELAGIVRGVKRDGQVQISGWVGPRARDSSSRVMLAGVDMVALQPYFIKKNEAQVSNGALDLNLESEVRNEKLDGKGKIILKNLQFAPSRGFFDTFMGLPRNAVISFLKDHNNAIDVDFVLQGDTSNPSFSLNERLSTRIAAAMAGELGVSIQNVAEGLGTLGQKGVEGAGGVVEGVGSAVRRLFGSAQR